MYQEDFLEKLSRFFMRLAKFFAKLAIFCVIIYVIGMQLFNLGHRLFYERAIDEENGKEVVFEILKTDDVDTIAKNLEESGLIDDTLAFKFRAKIYKTNFTPNSYTLKTNMTIKNMLDIFDHPSADVVVKKTDEKEYAVGAEGDEEEIIENSEN